MRFIQIGLQHPRIRQVRAVIANSSPNPRRLFVAEGLWAHRTLLELDVPIEALFWCPEAAYADEAHARVGQIAALAHDVYRVSPRVLQRIAERDRPDGLISLVALPCWDPGSLPLRRQALALVADAIEIPGNLGTLLRTLDACGGDLLVLTNRRTRLTHPKVFRGSRGMNLRVPVIEFAETDEAIAWLLGRHFSIYLATPGRHASPYRDVVFGERTALVVGNERTGITAGWLAQDFHRLKVPMLGVADSLNVGVCAAILLYEARAHLGRLEAELSR